MPGVLPKTAFSMEAAEMDMETVRNILLWWFLFFMFAHDWMYRFHGRWFHLSTRQFDAIHYGAMAFYKIVILVFNMVPLVVLYLIK